MPHILLIVTSEAELEGSPEPAGYWLEELAAPYYVFQETGHDVTIASPKGGAAPCNPLSREAEHQTADTKRFEQDETAMQHIRKTQRLATLAVDEYAAVCFVGGAWGDGGFSNRSFR